MKRRLTALVTAIILAACLFVLFACDKQLAPTAEPLPAVDYSLDNSFEVEFEKDDVSYRWSPKGYQPSYGLIFYVGTAIGPENYSYMAEFLASRGYLVIVPVVQMCMAYVFYNENEKAFADYPDVKFFVGGHSQGGGAALKRVMENTDKVLGGVFWAPLTYGQDSLADTTMPAIYIEGDGDAILTDQMKQDAKDAMPADFEYHLILGGNHMAFASGESMAKLGSVLGDGDLNGITDEEFKDVALSYTLSFMNTLVRARITAE